MLGIILTRHLHHKNYVGDVVANCELGWYLDVRVRVLVCACIILTLNSSYFVVYNGHMCETGCVHAHG